MIRSIVMAVTLAAGAAQAQTQWLDGGFGYVGGSACVTFNLETEVTSYASYWGATDASFPRTGDVSYVRGVAAVVGNPCSGGDVLGFDFFLPAGASTAISQQTPVRCIATRLSDGFTTTTDPNIHCSQTASLGNSGGLFFGFATTPRGWVFQIQVPVRFDRALAGIAGPAADKLTVVTSTANGTRLTDAFVTVPLRALVNYPSPSATFQGGSSYALTSFVFNYFTAGTAFIDAGTVSGSLSAGVTSASIPASGNGFAVNAQLTLNPAFNGTIFWRARFVTNAGVTFNGPEQSFAANGQNAVAHSLAVSSTGGGTGLVASDPQGLDCNGACTASFTAGTLVSLTATADPGSQFSGWSGACTGTGACNVTMNADATAFATFDLAPPVTSGSLDIVPSGLPAGSAAHLVVTGPLSFNSTFDIASGRALSLSGVTAGQYDGTASNVTVGADVWVPRPVLASTAVLAGGKGAISTTYSLGRTLSLTKDGQGAGTVTSDPPGLACGATCSAPFADGEPVTLTATAAAGSSFSGWSGACSGSSCTVAMSAARSATATFALVSAPDAGQPDAGQPDAGQPDAGQTDAGTTGSDAGASDAGAGSAAPEPGGCNTGAGGLSSATFVLLAFVATRRFRKRPALLLAALVACSPSAEEGGGFVDPPGFSAIVFSDSSIRLEWTAVPGATAYRLQRKTGSAGYATLHEGADPTYTDTGLTPGTAYQYLLQTVNAAGASKGVEATSTTLANQAFSPADAARAIVEATDPAGAVQATMRVLAAGGVAVGDDSRIILAAQTPAASWYVNPELALNLAIEAKDRAVSGRFTATQLGQMWLDMGFPFAGQGTPGQQLMGFLRAWVSEAALAPAAPGSFAPLFLAEMARRQVPPVELTDAASLPDDLRFTLLEIDLLAAAFDRSVQAAPAAGLRNGARTAAVSDGACDAMKKFFGAIGGKALEKDVDYVKGQLSDAALHSMGLSEADIEAFNHSFGQVFEALGFMMDIVKLIQFYANTHVALTVDGPNPVHAPMRSEARVQVAVTGLGGISDAAWESYMQQAGPDYQNVQSCLSFLGMPLPSELKEIAKNVDTWRVAWDLPSGHQHASIQTDVNNFDASAAGYPFGMKLKRSGEASAKATLKVDVAKESDYAQLFGGPEKQADVTVSAKVFAAEPPSPALLLKVTSLLGTASALIDLSIGWIETAFPPASTAKFQVIFHEPPPQLQASMDFSMRYLYGQQGAGTDFTMTATASATLDYLQGTYQSYPDVEAYTGTGAFNYTSVSGAPVPAIPDCTFSYVPFDGTVSWSLAPPGNLLGQLNVDGPVKLDFGIADVQSSPHEKLTISCPNAADIVQQPLGNIILALEFHYDGAITPNGGSQQETPGMPLNLWTQLPDKSLQRVFNGPRVFPIASQNISIEAETTTFRLTPVFQ